MDIVIPLAESKINHLDLKFVLRGIEKHLYGYDDIFIVGAKPKWIQGVAHIPFIDDPKPEWKERNIYRKIMAACEDDRISGDFFFMNDDHFLLDDVDCNNYPFYYKGTCYDSVISNSSHYRATMNHTMRLLLGRGFKDINADTHTPIVYNKKLFSNTFNPVHWETKYGYGIKSIYCAVNKKKMTFMPDCKISKKVSLTEVKELVMGRHIISCTDAALKGGLLPFLEEKFPQKSSYEK